MDGVIVKAFISRGCNGDSSAPRILVADGTTRLSKYDWKVEQYVDPDIGLVITLINKETLLQYVVKEGDSFGMRVLLKYQKDLMIKGGLLYREATLKGHNQPVAQFVLPEVFSCKMVLACYDDFGDMGMDRTLGLLQEGFFWPKMAEDV